MIEPLPIRTKEDATMMKRMLIVATLGLASPALAHHEPGHDYFEQGEPAMAGAVVCDKAEQIVDYLEAAQISDEASTEVLEAYSQLANKRNEPSCVVDTIVFTPVRVATEVADVPIDGKFQRHMFSKYSRANSTATWPPFGHSNRGDCPATRANGTPCLPPR